MKSRTKIAALVGTGVVGCALLPFLVDVAPASSATIAQDAPARPTVSSFAASPTTLTASGGPVALSADITNATECEFSSRPALAGLPATVPCSNGPVNQTVTIPAITGRNPKTYTFSLAVTGTVTVKAPAVKVTQTLPPTPPVTYWGKFTSDDLSSPKEALPLAMPLPGTVVQVASNANAGYALLSNGTVYAWGWGDKGELGDGTTTSSFDSPVQVQFPAGVTIASLPTDALPYQGALAIDTNGNAWGWGLNAAGYLCLGNKVMQTVPVELPFTNVTTATGQAYHTTFDASGTVYSCGAGGAYGALGDGNLHSSSTPVAVVGLPAGQQVVALVSSWSNTGALLASGAYYDWGYNAGGQLGDGSTAPSYDAGPVSLPAPIVQLTLGGSDATNGQTIALLANGAMYAWGTDQDGQLGDGIGPNQLSPVLVAPPAGVTFKAVASGGSTTFGISTTGELYSWGSAAAGLLGAGKQAVAPGPYMVEPGVTQLSPTAQTVIALAAGS
jgi:alpha-tubulin suppressor-like RCC1 family protein